MSARNRGGRRALPFSFLALSFSFLLLLVRNTASAAANVTTSGDGPKMPGERRSHDDDASNAMQLHTGGRSMRGSGVGGGRGQSWGRNTSRNATVPKKYKPHHGRRHHRKHKGSASPRRSPCLGNAAVPAALLSLALLLFI